MLPEIKVFVFRTAGESAFKILTCAITVTVRPDAIVYLLEVNVTVEESEEIVTVLPDEQKSMIEPTVPLFTVSPVAVTITVKFLLTASTVNACPALPPSNVTIPEYAGLIVGKLSCNETAPAEPPNVTFLKICVDEYEPPDTEETNGFPNGKINSGWF